MSDTDDSIDGVDHPKKQMGVKFYNVVTTGHLLMAASAIIPVLVWGLRLEGRVDLEADRRGQLQQQIVRVEGQIVSQGADVSKRIADQAEATSRRSDRTDRTLEELARDIRSVMIQVGASPARPFPERSPIPERK